MAEPTPPSAQPPYERAAPRLGTPSAAAAGLDAVAKTVQLAAGMGLIRGARLADLWLQPRIAGDLALLKGLSKEMLEAEAGAPGTVCDHDFIRTHDQFNTTIYGLDDRYRGVFGGRRVVFMHEQDIRDRGLQKGQLVDLTNRHGGVERMARAFMVAPYRIPRGCVATYFPEANVLVSIDSVAEGSNTPTSKFVLVTIEPAEAEEYEKRQPRRALSGLG